MSFEKDISAIKKLMESEPVFKAAGPEDLNKRKAAEDRAREAREAARKAEGIVDFCPHCKADLRDQNIGAYATGKEYFTEGLFWDSELESWNYGERDTNDSSVDGYLCGKCNKVLHIGTDFDPERTL